MCQVDPFGLTCPRNRRCTSGAYVCVQRHTVVWSTDKPRSAISSSTSRRLSENRRYHRTQVTIISAANWRLRNKGTRRNPIRSPYQIPSPEVATLPFSSSSPPGLCLTRQRILFLQLLHCCSLSKLQATAKVHT